MGPAAAAAGFRRNPELICRLVALYCYWKKDGDVEDHEWLGHGPRHPTP